MRRFSKVAYDTNIIIVGQTLYIFNYKKASISEYDFTFDGHYYADLRRPHTVTTGFDPKDLNNSVPLEGRTYLNFTN